VLAATASGVALLAVFVAAAFLLKVEARSVPKRDDAPVSSEAG